MSEKTLLKRCFLPDNEDFRDTGACTAIARNQANLDKRTWGPLAQILHNLPIPSASEPRRPGGGQVGTKFVPAADHVTAQADKAVCNGGPPRGRWRKNVYGVNLGGGSFWPPGCVDRLERMPWTTRAA
jgi:hypothetical protein